MQKYGHGRLKDNIKGLPMRFQFNFTKYKKQKHEVTNDNFQKMYFARNLHCKSSTSTRKGDS